MHCTTDRMVPASSGTVSCIVGCPCLVLTASLLECDPKSPEIGLEDVAMDSRGISERANVNDPLAQSEGIEDTSDDLLKNIRRVRRTSKISEQDILLPPDLNEDEGDECAPVAYPR